MKYKLIVLLYIFLFLLSGCQINVDNVVSETKMEGTIIEKNAIIESSIANIEDETKDTSGDDVKKELVTYEDKENGVLYNTAMYEKIILSDNYVSKYDKLTKAIEEYNLISDKLAKEFIEENKESIREMIKERNDNTLQLSYENMIIFHRIDDKVFSFNESPYAYTGGAHGYGSPVGRNYDVNTGIEISSDDVFNDKVKLKEVLMNKLRTLEIEHEESMYLFPDWADTINEHFDNDEPFNIMIYKDKIEIVFDQYYLGPWSSGPITVVLEYNQYKDIIDKKYFE